MTICPLPQGELLEGFRTSLDREAVSALVREHLLVDAELVDCSADYVRFKEQDGCLVGWRVTLRDAEGRLLESYVTARSAPDWRLHSEADRLVRRMGEQWRCLRSLALVRDAGLLLLAFPVDRALADLRRMVRASKIRNLLLQHRPAIAPDGLRPSKSRSLCRIVRYKPERRAILHWSIGMVDVAAALAARSGVYVRVYAEPLGGRVRSAQDAARRAGVRCPGVLALPHAGLLVEPELEGTAWTGDPGQAEAAGELLVRLHAAEAPAKVPQRTPLGQLDRVLRACEDLDKLDPDLGRRAAEVADRLARHVPSPTPPCLLHGDFHRGQLLFSQGIPGLVDFDRSAAGPPAMDLADFWAHEALRDPDSATRSCGELENAYARRGELPASDDRWWYRTCALLRIAMTPFRGLRPDWPARVAALLDLAEAGAEELSP